MDKQRASFIWFLVVTALMVTGLSTKIDARVLNMEDEGSLTIHKLLNPSMVPNANHDEKGTVEEVIIGGKPLSGVEFSVYGKLTEKEISELTYDSFQGVKDNYKVNTSEVEQFIKGRTPSYKGVTDSEGVVKFNHIPVDTNNLGENVYLIVETKTPGLNDNGQIVVNVPSQPVLVNIPSPNPKEDTEDAEVDHYLYDVDIFMKNYQQLEPVISKEIDKSSVGAGEEVEFIITVDSLPSEIDKYQLLEVEETLDPSLQFNDLGHTNSILGERSVQFYNGTTEETTYLLPNKDYLVTTPESGHTGTIKWDFTPAGIQKLAGIQDDDDSYIKFYFGGFMDNEVERNTIIPNHATLNFVNKWGYGTKDGVERSFDTLTASPKPSNTVDIVLGDPLFEKVDKSNPNEKLQGAEFLLRMTSTQPVTAYSHKPNDIDYKLITYPAGTELYAVIEDANILGWTPDWQEAIRENWLLTSGKDGKFHVKGLEYSREVFYRKMYIFMVMGIKNINGTNMEYVDHYEYVLANRRKQEGITQEDFEKEITPLLAAHPGDENGVGAWRFFKESDADPTVFNIKPLETVDYLGKTVNDYDLIEVKAPNKYTPVEHNLTKVAKENQRQLLKVDDNGNYQQAKDMSERFKHPFAFTVPFGSKDWSTGKVEDIEQALSDVTLIPNAKKPLIPNTGNKAAMVLLICGGLILLVAIYYRRKDRATE